MADKITIGLDNQTGPGFDEIGKSTDELVNKAKSAEQAYNEFVDSVIQSEQPQQQSAEAMQEIASETEEYKRILEQLPPAQEASNDGFVEAVAHLNNLKGLLNGSTASFRSLFTLLGGAVVPLAAVAAAFESVVLVLDNTGKTADDTRSNLDRLIESVGKTSKAVAEAAAEVTEAESGWKNFNDNVTSLSNGFIDLLKNAQAAASGIPVEMAEASDKIDALNKRREEGNKFIEEAEKRAAAASKERAEAERLGRITTTAAIDREVEALKRQFQQSAETAAQSEETQKAFTDKFDQLAKRRVQILEENAEKHRKFEEETDAALRKMEEEGLRRHEDAQEKRTQAERDAADQARQLAEKAAKERLDVFTESYRRELERQREAAEKAIDIERQRLDGLRALMKEQGAPSGEQLLKQVNPADVLRRIQQQRAAEARRKFSEENEADVTSTQDMNRFRAERDRAGRAAIGQATRDFRAGRVGADEFSQAQGQVAREQLGAMQQQGKLSGDFVRLATEQINAAQQTQTQVNQMQKQVESLMRASREVGRDASQGRARLQSSGYRG